MATLNLTITTTAGQDSGLQWQLATRTTVAPANPGTGYVVGNVLTVVGGTGTAATYLVDSVDAVGAVTGISVLRSGDYTVQPTSPMQTTSNGAGTGCRLRLKYADATAMLTDFVSDAVRDYRRQWKDAQRAKLAEAVESASNAQLTNAATALGVVLP
jgi:hypothetical protein